MTGAFVDGVVEDDAPLLTAVISCSGSLRSPVPLYACTMK
jgi:hypothetical protein